MLAVPKISTSAQEQLKQLNTWIQHHAVELLDSPDWQIAPSEQSELANGYEHNTAKLVFRIYPASGNPPTNPNIFNGQIVKDSFLVQLVSKGQKDFITAIVTDTTIKNVKDLVATLNSTVYAKQLTGLTAKLAHRFIPPNKFDPFDL